MRANQQAEQYSKDKICDKKKTYDNWSIGLTKKSLLTYHLPKISLVVFTVNSQMTK